MAASLRQRVLKASASARAKGLTFNQLVKRLGPDVQRDLLTRLVRSMTLTGQLVRVGQGRLINPEPLGWVVGRLTVTRRGDGFVIPEGARGEDLFVPRRALGGALAGDRVAAQVVGRQRGREAGGVVAILERTHTRTVGQYYHAPRRATVVPKNRRLGRTVEVPALPRREARDGMWVSVEITDWTRGDDPLIGRVVEVLGAEGDPDTDLPVILAARGVDPAFPEKALREVEKIPLEIPAEVLEQRRDLRGERVFTIDPATAKDFDDALSVEVLGPKRWRLGVHIADVAEHVCPDTALDAMALARGTSIYPVDQVIPMLPERLSNLVCSLRPDEDKLTLSAFLVIDEHGDVVEPPDLCESVIRSMRRLDYGQVQRFFDDAMSDEDRAAVSGVEDDLRAVRDVAQALNAMRQRRGALDLDLPETEILLDDRRCVTDIVRRERWESHRLVEACMLAGNEAVAWHLLKKKIPSLHRDHDPPDGERLGQLLPVLRSLGMKQRIGVGNIGPRDYQKILNQTASHPASRIIHRLLLRTLRLAVYDPENRGHFGLASECYTHFTSPIRRYPDLIVHRILKDHLRGKSKPQGAAREVWVEELLAIAKVSSHLERRAERVERDMVKLKTLRFIEPRMGDEVTGMISGVAAFGLWIELDDVPADGFAHVSTLEEDWYEFDETLHVLRGEGTRATWRLGQRVRVRLVSVDFTALELDVVVLGKA